MRVLIIGGGAREHALAWRIAQSSEVDEIFSTPGNAGLDDIGMCLPHSDIDDLFALTVRLRPDLVVVGPEGPLAKGLVDRLAEKNIPVFGPSAKAAQLESSKIFAKDVMKYADVPTPSYKWFSCSKLAESFINDLQYPSVIKADGLAQGKGVFVCHCSDEAIAALNNICELGKDGEDFLIEDYLEGPECTVMAISDSENFVVFPAIQDYKPVGDGDTGPNTGGMGAVTPVPGCDSQMLSWIASHIIKPVLDEMRRRRTPFKGCLYAGLKLTTEGPKVLEFNCRFGDPEVQVALTKLDENPVHLMLGAIYGNLKTRPARCKPGAAVCVVAASGGYPGDYEMGYPITGLKAAEDSGAIVFHAGTKSANGPILTNGGRVLNVVATGDNLEQALDKAYQGMAKINFEEMYYRRDIGCNAK